MFADWIRLTGYDLRQVGGVISRRTTFLLRSLTFDHPPSPNEKAGDRTVTAVVHCLPPSIGK